MNDAKRKDITKSITEVEEAHSIIEDVAAQEQESLDNMPENLWESDRYQNMEETVSDLEDIQGELEDIASRLYEIINK